MSQRYLHRLAAVLVVLPLVTTQLGSSASQQAPTDLRERLEGTWELVEWHIDGEILRPPQIGGRWSNRDGVVLATFHRTSGGTFQSTANYGTYDISDTTWSYRYHHRLSTSGPSPEQAAVTVRTNDAERMFDISYRGDILMLDRPNDHREYEGPEFRFMPNGQLLRKWRRIE